MSDAITSVEKGSLVELKSAGSNPDKMASIATIDDRNGYLILFRR